jgi:hypothetical protein
MTTDAHGQACDVHKSLRHKRQGFTARTSRQAVQVGRRMT